MRAGDLKHLVSIQRAVLTQNDYGEVIEDWQELYSCRASIRPISGKEIAINHSIVNVISHKVHIRYKPDIKPSDRIVFDGRIFNITSVINYEEKNISLGLLCKEIY